MSLISAVASYSERMTVMSNGVGKELGWNQMFVQLSKAGYL